MSDDVGEAGSAGQSRGCGAVSTWSQCLADTVPDGACRLDEERQLTAVNDALVELTGYSRAELLGEHVSVLVAETDPPESELAIRRLVEDDDPEPVAVTLTTADGENVPCTLHVGCPDDTEEILCVLRPYAAREGAEPEPGIDAATTVSGQRQTDSGALRREQDLIDRILDAAPVGIAVIEQDGRVVRSNEYAVSELGIEEAERVGDHDVFDEDGTYLQPGERPYMQVFETGEPVYDERLQIEVVDGGRRLLSVNTVPIRDDGEVKRVVVAVEDVTQLEERSHRLKQERDTFASELNEVFERIDDAFYGVDEEFQFTYVNERAAELLQHSEAELLGRSVWEVFPEATETPVWEAFHTALAEQEPTSFEFYFDSLEFWIEASVYPSETGLSVYFRDVTERRERERRLEEERDMFAEGPAIVFRWKAAEQEGWPVEYVSENVEDVLGYTPAELESGQVPYTDLLLEEDLDRIASDVERNSDETTERFSHDPYRVRTKSGDIRWVKDTTKIIRDETGEITHYLGYLVDITERKEREQALRERERQLSTLIDNIPGMVYRCRNERGWPMEFVSDACRELTGYDPEAIERGEVKFGEDVIVEPDPDEVWEEIQARVTDHEPFSVTYRIETADGERRWVRDYGRGVFDDGDLVEIEGIISDITERTERERELERYERIIENVPVGVYRNKPGPEGEFVEANPAIADIFDADSVEEFKRHTTSELYPDPERRQEFSERLEREGVVEDVELKQETLDGNVIWIAVTAIRIEEDGEVYFDGIVQDITERRQFEKALQALHVTTRDLFRAETDGRIGWLVAEAARDVLDVTFGAVYLHDEGRDVLSPVTYVNTEGEPTSDLSELPHDGENLVSYVYETDEVASYDDVAMSKYRIDDLDVRSGMFVSLGEHGVLVAGAEEPGGLDEGTERLLSVLAENARAAFDRIDRERELRARIEQQDVVADLGQRALETDDTDGLFEAAVERIAETLDTDYCKVLDRRAESGDLLLRAGVGWREGLVGEATVDAEGDSQAGYALGSGGPVVVEDLDAETRFDRAALLTSHGVKSGICVPIGPAEDPWGILGTHDTERATFTEHDVNFVQAVAHILATAIERVDHEREIRRQRERLAALNHINGIVRDVIRALLQQSTREEIEQLVCDHLAGSVSYEFAWVGEVEEGSDEVVPRAVAGAEGYLQDTTITVDDSPTGQGPTGRALRTGEVQVTQDVSDGPDYDPWADAARERGVRASAAVPITYENTTYGVLNIYTRRSDAFDGEEQAVVEQLGAVMGHAISAVERERVLMSDEVIQINLRIADVFAALGVDGEASGRIDLDRTVPVGDGDYLVYGTATEEGVETAETLAGELPHWTDLSLIGDGDDEKRFELRLTEPPATSVVAAHGGHIQSATIEGGTYRMTVELPADADVREAVEGIQEVYSDIEVVAQRHTTTDDRSLNRQDISLGETLTDRQQAALQAAYFAGFFEWPRASTGEEVADAIGVSAPTFHQHLRAAERRLLAAIIDGAGSAVD